MPKLAEMLSEHALGFAGQLSNEELAAWLDIRLGKLTASRMGDAMSYLKDGKTPSAKRTTLMKQLLVERETDINFRHYVTKEMEWGLQQEPIAKLAYTQHTGKRVAKTHFYDHPLIDNFGCTPDGELGAEWFYEFKCPTTVKFMEWVRAGVVPEEHRPQMLSQIACGRRGGVIFVAFDPRVKLERQLFIREFVPKLSEVERVEDEARKFNAELEAAWEQYIDAAATGMETV